MDVCGTAASTNRDGRSSARFVAARRFIALMNAVEFSRRVESIAIGTPLMGARQRIGHRREQERHDAAGQARSAASPRHLPCLRGRAAPQTSKARSPRHNTQASASAASSASADQMSPIHMVRELVREDGLNFIVGVRREQRVGYQDATRATDADQRGVRLGRAIADPPLIGAQHGRARSSLPAPAAVHAAPRASRGRTS